MRDRSPVWIGLCDLALAVLAIVIVAVNPPAPKARGVEMKAELLATVEWAVDIDADVDIHMMPPSHHPVFYGARDVGCATLDRDNRGFLDSIITLADGSQTRVDSDKETIAIRCIEPGHYDFGANLYAYRVGGAGQENRRDLGLKAHSRSSASIQWSRSSSRRTSRSTPSGRRSIGRVSTWGGMAFPTLSIPRSSRSRTTTRRGSLERHEILAYRLCRDG
jgi:hypothetical protein